MGKTSETTYLHRDRSLGSYVRWDTLSNGRLMFLIGNTILLKTLAIDLWMGWNPFSKMDLCEPTRLGLSNIIVEGNSWHASWSASGSSKWPCPMVDVVDEVLQLTSKLKVTYVHVKHRTIAVADSLAREGVGWLVLVVVPRSSSLTGSFSS